MSMAGESSVTNLRLPNKFRENRQLQRGMIVNEELGAVLSMYWS